MRALLCRTLRIKQLYKLLGGSNDVEFDAAMITSKADDRGFAFPHSVWTELTNLQFAVELERDGELCATIRRFLAAVMHDLEYCLWLDGAIGVVTELIDYLSLATGIARDVNPQQKIEDIIVSALLSAESVSIADCDLLRQIRVFLRTYLLSMTVFVCYEALIVANLVLPKPL